MRANGKYLGQITEAVVEMRGAGVFGWSIS
jgi:hypothetical protein